MSFPKTILITGCSSGFGLLTAVLLARRGHKVWATMRDLSKRNDLDHALAQVNAHATIRKLDVTRPETITQVIDEMNKTHGTIDILINNAGYGVAGFFEDLTEDQIRGVMETNFFGVQNVCREVIPLMRQQKSGKIINISSIAGQVAVPCLGAYNASKWALEAFSESLYHELALFGISVVLVEPGSYATNIFTSNAHYATRFNDSKSPYYAFSQKLKTIALKEKRKFTKDPKDVARLIERIIDHPRPHLRYVSDLSSWFRVIAQKIMPPPMATKIFRRFINGN